MQAPLANEEQLIRQAQDGDTGAFDVLVMQYQKRFYNLAYRMLSHQDDAAEVTQDAFLQMYKNIGHFEGKAQFSTWGTRIVMNLCLNLRKKKKRRNMMGHLSLEDTGASSEQRPLHETLPDLKPDAVEGIYSTQVTEALEQGLSQLPDIHRQVVLLRDVHGVSYQEIAETLSLNEGTVKSRLARARTALKEWIRPRL